MNSDINSQMISGMTSEILFPTEISNGIALFCAYCLRSPAGSAKFIFTLEQTYHEHENVLGCSGIFWPTSPKCNHMWWVFMVLWKNRPVVSLEAIEGIWIAFSTCGLLTTSYSECGFDMTICPTQERALLKYWMVSIDLAIFLHILMNAELSRLTLIQFCWVRTDPTETLLESLKILFASGRAKVLYF